MNNVKRCLASFSPYNPKQMAETLEAMAAHGWMLESLGTYIWTYRRIPPKKLRFAVTYFPKASDFDPGPTEGELTKADFCALDGWQLAARLDVIQIFYTDREDAVPIETDPVIQVENIYRSMKKGVFLPHLLILATILFQLYMQISQFRRDPIEYLSHASLLYLFPFWCLLLVDLVLQLWIHLHWHRVAKKAAEQDGIFHPFPFTQKFNFLVAALLLLFLSAVLPRFIPTILLLIGGILLIIWGTNDLKQHLKQRGASRRVNQAAFFGSAVLGTLLLIGVLTLVLIRGSFSFQRTSKPVGSYEYQGDTFEIYDDPLPLEVEDLTAAEGQWSKEMRHQETILLGYTEYIQHPLLTESQDLPDLSYTMVDVKHPFLYKLCKQHFLTLDEDDVKLFHLSYRPMDAAPFGAAELYQRCYEGKPSSQYLIFLEKKILTLDLDGSFTPEQQRQAIHILAQLYQ